MTAWLGRQLSRTKAAQGYLGIILLAINAISLVSMAFGIRARYSLAALPALLLITMVLGWYMDRTGLVSNDLVKGMNMQYRFMNTGEYRLFEFWLALVKIMKPDKTEEMELMFKEFSQKWGVDSKK